MTAERVVVAAFPMTCDNLGKDSTRQISVTVYSDGGRAVGCKELKNGKCRLVSRSSMSNGSVSCIHLSPKKSSSRG